jgi:fermentation-respiration switch protein FrsA (DUF1100 family)
LHYHVIAGWWINSGSSSPAVILLHTVRADRSTMVSRAQLLKDHGFSVLLIDLQAHGETPGEAITFGARESADVVAALAWLKHSNPERRIGVIGCSMGGAAVLLGPQPSGFDAVVLEAVYPRITKAVENRIRIRLGPMVSSLAPLLLMQLEPRLHIAASDLEPIKSINHLGAPVVIAAGSDDEHTTLLESEELYAAAANPKELWLRQELPTPSATDVWYGLEHRLNRSTHADVRPIRSATHRFHRNATGAASGPLSIIPPITFRHSGTMRI